MKEIWTLIELLENWDWRNVTYNKQSDWGYMFRLGDLAFREERICSKKFWFIKWLVENDKIDRSKVLEEIWSCIKISWLWPHYSFYSALLMILAVSDTPIEDLISYLK
jgi:hypothetical protein